MGCCNIKKIEKKRSTLEIFSKLVVIAFFYSAFRSAIFIVGTFNKNYANIFVAFSQHCRDSLVEIRKESNLKK
jgi:hypothetical protein